MKKKSRAYWILGLDVCYCWCLGIRYWLLFGCGIECSWSQKQLLEGGIVSNSEKFQQAEIKIQALKLRVESLERNMARLLQSSEESTDAIQSISSSLDCLARSLTIIAKNQTAEVL